MVTEYIITVRVTELTEHNTSGPYYIVQGTNHEPDKQDKQVTCSCYSEVHNHSNTNIVTRQLITLTHTAQFPLR